MLSKKNIIRLVIFCISVIILIFTLAHFPSLFFRKNFNYKSFQIHYSKQEIILDENVKSCLDSVDSILRKSPLFNQGQKHHLYFTRGTTYEKIMRLIGKKNMAFATPRNNQIYSAIPDFNKGIIHRNHNEIEVMNMIQVFSHEAVHNQMRLVYSRMGIPTTPYWINEGFCEYVAYSPIRNEESYELKKLVEKLESNDDFWIKTEYNAFSPREYIYFRIIMEYLIDVKSMDIHEIIADHTLEPHIVYEEIKLYIENE